VTNWTRRESMGDFFNGWRRKAGCVLLVMAALCLGMWIRGRVIRDIYIFGNGKEDAYTAVATSPDGIYWAYKYETEPELFDRSVVPGWHSAAYPPDEPRDFENYRFINPWIFKWRYCWGGFDFGENHFNTGPLGWVNRYWVVPYWAIACPLTLLSAYLILWPRKRRTKPSEATPTTICQPAPADGV